MKIILIVFYLLSFLLSYLKKTPLWLYYIFALVLALTAGFRDVSLFMDSEIYTNAFYGDVNEKYELSFVFIVFVAKKLSNTPFFMFFIYAMLGVLIKAYAIKRLTNLYFLSLSLYISYFYILHDMTQIRAGVASAIFLLGIKYLEERNALKYFGSCLIAIFFHYSAIIVIPLYFFIKSGSINKTLWAALIPLSYIFHVAGFTLSTLIPLIPIGFVQTLWDLYKFRMSAGIGLEINIFNVTQLIRCFIACFMLYYSTTIMKENRYFILLLKIYILGIISFVLLADIPDFAFRVSQFLLIVEIILIPLMIYTFKQKKIAYIFPAFIGLIFLFLNLFYAKLVL